LDWSALADKKKQQKQTKGETTAALSTRNMNNDISAATEQERQKIVHQIQDGQRRTKNTVDEHCRKLLISYQALLQRHVTLLASDLLPGRHEELAVSVAAENIVSLPSLSLSLSLCVSLLSDSRTRPPSPTITSSFVFAWTHKQVQRVHKLLEMVHDLRIQACVLHQHQLAVAVDDDPTLSSHADTLLN
jgi:hypothetical protein